MPTLRDIATRAGVSIMTVSRALRNDPEIAPGTRSRLLALAAELGYSPNAAARALCAFKTRDQPKTRGQLGTLALLAPAPFHEHLVSAPSCAGLVDELRVHASKLGYALDFILYPAAPGARAALNRMLDARGIRGLLLYAPTAVGDSHSDLTNLDWPDRVVVSLLSAASSPRHHTVRSNSQATLNLAVTKLRQAGCRRIGLVVPDLQEWCWVPGAIGGFEAAHLMLAGRQPLPPLILPTWDHAVVADWIRQKRVDGLLGNLNEASYAALRAHRRSSGGDFAFCGLDVLPHQTSLAGIMQNRTELFHLAADLLSGMLARNAYGPPALPHIVELAGRWRDGPSLSAPA
jgi:LacI family transcriptional regulator